MQGLIAVDFKELILENPGNCPGSFFHTHLLEFRP